MIRIAKTAVLLSLFWGSVAFALAEAPETRAKSVLVVNARTGVVLYEKNADQQRAAASTQKLLTALIIAERGFLDQRVVVAPTDTYAEPVKLNIKGGEVYQRIDLLRALLVKSPNDVARCLARDYAGSIEAFADVMNAKARQLGATHSHFLNPNGLPLARSIFHGARSRDHCTCGLRKSDDPFDCLSAATCLSLCQRAHARTGKHKQGFETIALLQWNEDRLHRGGRALFDRKRHTAGTRRDRRCPRRWQGRCLEGRLRASFLGLVDVNA